MSRTDARWTDCPKGGVRHSGPSNGGTAPAAYARPYDQQRPAHHQPFRHSGAARPRGLPRIPGTPARRPSRGCRGSTRTGGRADVAVVGIPFDTGVSYRPGARFGGNAIREASRLLRPYNPAQDASPFALAQVADAGDIAVNPFDIGEAIETVEQAAGELLDTGARLMTLGGDHTLALPLLRAAARKHGPVALLHFDAHLDTWDTYFGPPTPTAPPSGVPWRRGCWTPRRSPTWARAGRCTASGTWTTTPRWASASSPPPT
ncbi:hypothetical protein TPA0909_60880 [Streptomyces albus]|nr:hypothetical protein TPA0909_60880 [Streptomyces albus]